MMVGMGRGVLVGGRVPRGRGVEEAVGTAVAGKGVNVGGNPCAFTGTAATAAKVGNGSPPVWQLVNRSRRNEKKRTICWENLYIQLNCSA